MSWFTFFYVELSKILKFLVIFPRPTSLKGWHCIPLDQTFFLKINLFIYLWLSLVAASGGHSSWRCAGLSLSRPLLLRSTGSRRAGSAVVAHGPSCSVACGIFPDQGSNLCPLHWQADSQPLRHQGSPGSNLFEKPTNCGSVEVRGET